MPAARQDVSEDHVDGTRNDTSQLLQMLYLIRCERWRAEKADYYSMLFSWFAGLAVDEKSAGPYPAHPDEQLAMDSRDLASGPESLRGTMISPCGSTRNVEQATISASSDSDSALR
jgi:hypothetical protein